jgi:histidyl-tRNA synthetase
MQNAGAIARNDQHHSSINLSLDFTLARGLNYYTGIIFEAKAPAEVKIGSMVVAEGMMT